MAVPAKVAADVNSKLRALAHDLSNSVDTILQASYLLTQMKLEDNVKKWTDLVDKAGRDCARINREIQEILRSSV